MSKYEVTMKLTHAQYIALCALVKKVLRVYAPKDERRKILKDLLEDACHSSDSICFGVPVYACTLKLHELDTLMVGYHKLKSNKPGTLYYWSIEGSCVNNTNHRLDNSMSFPEWLKKAA